MPTGMTMSIVGGHGDFKVGLNGEQNASHLVNGPEDMRRAVREQFAKGAKNVKLMATGGIMSAAVDGIKCATAVLTNAQYIFVFRLGRHFSQVFHNFYQRCY